MFAFPPGPQPVRPPVAINDDLVDLFEAVLEIDRMPGRSCFEVSRQAQFVRLGAAPAHNLGGRAPTLMGGMCDEDVEHCVRILLVIDRCTSKEMHGAGVNYAGEAAPWHICASCCECRGGRSRHLPEVRGLRSNRPPCAGPTLTWVFHGCRRSISQS